VAYLLRDDRCDCSYVVPVGFCFCLVGILVLPDSFYAFVDFVEHVGVGVLDILEREADAILYCYSVVFGVDDYPVGIVCVYDGPVML